MSVKVILLEDEDLVRGGIRMILDADPDIEVVAEDGDGANATELVTKHRPDVVLTDIQMPVVGGLEVTRRLTALPDAPAVALLTTFDLDEYVHAALRDGAAGFLLKDTPPRELASAVHVVAGGEAMLSPRITTKLLSTFAGNSNAHAAQARTAELTAREREVAVAVAQGLNNAEIASKLYMSQSTVKVHLGRIMTKLDAANRTQVAITTHDAGLI
ncbi:DNA-binding NarL/FixJ family response regulator [Actinopolyspora biskrensis]|uniref:DNA-binding NarL/FixJ family response regulator n=1 Tax=Actinopolyspora biskrensis TaxID=1470178 RepID=A0A852YV92_9ACTN|nr:response regulator transcription factor [Actinopolyspora biskrensis]NYH77489.1 DNA-binding NarL/FixJ family response regulator [Actinopolyspora biskrensis]